MATPLRVQVFLCLLMLQGVCFGASVENPNSQTSANGTAKASVGQQDVEHEATSDAFYQSPINQPLSESFCENDMKAVNQEVWELRQQVQVLQLKQDMTSLRSELRDLAGHVNSGHPHSGFEDTVTHTEQSSAAVQSDPAVQSSEAAPRGSVYVRWGARGCPDGATLVYSGVVGGGLFTSSGAGVNALCLPLNPVYGDQQPTKWNTYLYGAEYDTLPSPEHDLDVVCSVCMSPRFLTIMIPATNVCHHGWTVEYTGYLMAGKDYHDSGTEFICMDASREGRHGSKANNNGKLFYYTLSTCGSLPCPPYEEGKVVLCVVCSK